MDPVLGSLAVTYSSNDVKEISLSYGLSSMCCVQQTGRKVQEAEREINMNEQQESDQYYLTPESIKTLRKYVWPLTEILARSMSLGMFPANMKH